MSDIILIQSRIEASDVKPQLWGTVPKPAYHCLQRLQASPWTGYSLMVAFMPHGRSLLFSLSEKPIASGNSETFFEAYSCPILLCGLLSHSIGRFSSICGLCGLPCADMLS
jgi:hypothetical protein